MVGIFLISGRSLLHIYFTITTNFIIFFLPKRKSSSPFAVLKEMLIFDNGRCTCECSSSDVSSYHDHSQVDYSASRPSSPIHLSMFLSYPPPLLCLPKFHLFQMRSPYLHFYIASKAGNAPPISSRSNINLLHLWHIFPSKVVETRRKSPTKLVIDHVQM